MTPERIRENLVEVNARIAAIDEERALLIALVHAWEQLLRFQQGYPAIDQPGQEEAPFEDPAPPPASVSIEQPQQGPVGREARGDGKTPLPAAVPPPEGRGRTARSMLPEGDLKALRPKPIPAGTMRPCPDCDKSFDSGQGLSLHRRKVHSYQPWEPKPEGTSPPASVIRKGAEWYVCARCPLKFPSRDARDRHQATHPPIPTVEPVRAMGRGGGRRMTLARAAG